MRFQVLSSIFPGGSITGAPKKMAIELRPVGEDAPTAEAPEETPEAPETEAASAADSAHMDKPCESEMI